MRRTLLSIGIIILIIGIGFGIWYLLFQNRSEVSPPPPPTNITSNGTGTTAPIIGTSPILSFWILKNTESIYAIDTEGKIVSVSKTGGANETLSSQKITDFAWLKENISGTYAAIAFGKPGKETISIFGVDDRSFQPLPEGVRSLSWNPTNPNLLVYFKNINGSSAFETFDVSTKKITPVLTAALEDIDLSWVSASEIFISETPTAYTAGTIWVLDPSTKLLEKIVDQRTGLASLWSREENLGLLFFESTNGYAASLVDRKGVPIQGNIVPRTVKEKCAAKDMLIVCAVPKSLSAGVRLPDDYLKRKIYTIDDLWIWNEETNKTTTLVAASSKPFDATKLQISNGKVFFIDRYSKGLYALPLGN